MLRLLIAVCLSASCFAQEKAAPKKPESMFDVKKDLDIERVKRIDLQLQILQLQVQKMIDPIVKERNEVMERLCAGIDLAVPDCEVNTETGKVEKKKPVVVKDALPKK